MDAPVLDPARRAVRTVRRPWVRFIGIALITYAIWFVVYDLWLLPDGRLDEVVSLNVAAVSGGLLKLLGFEATVSGRIVRVPGVLGVEVANGCNGLSTIGIFLGFVLAYPGPWRARLWFVPMGVALVYLTNVSRVVVLLYAQRYAPQWFDPLHSFGATTIFYVVVFALWVWWTRLGERGQRKAAATAPAVAPG